MAHLIDKSALIAEIERKRDAALTRQKNLESIGQETIFNEMVANELNRILSFLNTLEVKEVDLDWQDIYSILYLERIIQHEFGDHEYSNEDLCQEVLKRFKEQKGEEV